MSSINAKSIMNGQETIGRDVLYSKLKNEGYKTSRFDARIEDSKTAKYIGIASIVYAIIAFAIAGSVLIHLGEAYGYVIDDAMMVLTIECGAIAAAGLIVYAVASVVKQVRENDELNKKQVQEILQILRHNYALASGYASKDGQTDTAEKFSKLAARMPLPQVVELQNVVK